ncbi:hypothetical protein ACN08Y_10480 [Rothia sp. P5764]|uniref:hypothetical protein n=1 Tax=Rothia sp. P5764 TaxID=3402654 RepID=UPI003AD18E29
MKKSLAYISLSAILLTGCGAAQNNPAEAPSSSAVASASSKPALSPVNTTQTMTFKADNGAVGELTLGTTPNTEIGDAATRFGQPIKTWGKLKIDNRNGSNSISPITITFIDPDGSKYEMTDIYSVTAGWYGNSKYGDEGHDEKQALYSKYGSFEIKPGEVAELEVASLSEIPQNVSDAEINGVGNTFVVKLTNDKLDAEIMVPQASSSPAASASAPSSKLRRAFTGTTLKGNDIGFAILDPAEQISLNEQMKGVSFEGSWGVLCSQMAVVDQLKETGVETTNKATGDTYAWRSIKYAGPERLGAGEDMQAINGVLDAASAQSMETGHNCALVMSDDPVAMMGADTATVGRYMGGGQIIDRAEIN